MKQRSTFNLGLFSCPLGKFYLEHTCALLVKLQHTLLCQNKRQFLSLREENHK